MTHWCVWRVLYFVVAATTTTTTITTFGMALSTSSSSSSPPQKRIHTIQVCQNKDCCQRFTGRASNLVQTLRQITYNPHHVVTIESTGCLAHCDKGPNVRIICQLVPVAGSTTTGTTTNDESVQHGIDSAHAAAAVLELVSGSEEFKIHPTFLAAWKVMEQAHQATDPLETERCLNSVINALTNDVMLAESISMAHALVLRAQLRLDDPDRIDAARHDVLRAAALDPKHPIVWRVLATVEEERHDMAAAIQALSQWAKYQPLFSTKVQKEIKRLQTEIKAT